jgi:hypothetical protein
MKRNRRRIVLVALVSSLFAVSFVESYAALEHAAVQAQIAWPQAWPWQVDGFILATALMVIEARDHARRWGVWWPRLGLFASTGLSTVIQFVYAPDGAGWLHAWSPLAVLFSFECLVWLAFTARPDWPLPPFPDPEPVPVDAPADPTPDQPKVARPSGRTYPPLTSQQAAKVERFHGQGWSATRIATEVGVTRQRVSAHLRNREPVPSRNGDRP